ncbi:TlpA family protein disulfide reductase [Nosocomiicoccus ampullae]|uniref:Thiol-disulfide isomerase/thioredoxin n=1 Tax=Nosocomiicoccus ampullae TaxID=489910 RepID=A0A9Q2CYX0_9STAP|nr:TlpA disulfide reductase family protein [Nosocomiicoccus ampullae]MBB5175728.1 thiol-disulfide isomerase/thioredoxin [Nosocomiicoccus ampullae]QYA47118.1 TlpA family protein disulfide reductase [Nosocomiicoccus ampullae]
MSKSIKVLIGIVLFLIVAFSIYTVITFSSDVLKEEEASKISDNESVKNDKAEGAQLNEYDFNAVTGDESLESIIKNNEVTVVNLFASWCNPCRNETPDLNDFYKKELPDNTMLVGLNVQDNKKSRDQFLEEFDVQYPIYNVKDEKDFMTDLQLIIIPTTLFVDSDGKIVKTYVGEISKKTLDSYIQYVKDE